MENLPTNMLLCNFNKKLESGIRQKFDIDPNTPVHVEWAEDGSCICSILIGNVDDIFSYIGYEDVQVLLHELLDATDVQMLDHYYWPDDSSSRAFDDFKKRVGITDPEVTCGAELPDEYQDAWSKTYEQNTIVEIKKDPSWGIT